MTALARAVEKRIGEAHKLREIALYRWFFGTPDAKTCPKCFGAHIGVRYIHGRESLVCRECGATNPKDPHRLP